MWWWSAAAYAVHDPAAFASLGTLDPDQPITIDTSAGTLTYGSVTFTGTSGQVGAVVFAFDEVLIDQPVTVIGTYSLVILSHGTLTVASSVDVSAVAYLDGPGGHLGGGDRQDGFGPGGGGGSYASGGGGGHGGSGGAAGYVVTPNHEAFGGATYGDPELDLNGGSGGGGSDYAFGGGGGGAVELGAIGRLDVLASGTIRADGGAGEFPGSSLPGGGGGAGGAILLHGAGGEVAGLLSARGGRGGDGQYGAGGGGGGRVVIRGLLALSVPVNVSGGAVGASQIGGYDAAPGVAGTLVFAPGTDLDGDEVVAELDCDDRDPAVFPGAAEVVCDGVDDDCDPETPDAIDGDQDGVACDLDCDDADAARTPGADEEPCNDVDDDCDATTEDGDCAPGPDDPSDLDQDGVSVADGDCDDHNDLRAPGNGEVECNGIDDDCDDATDDGTCVFATGPADPGCACDGSGGSGLGAVLAARQRRARARISSGASRK